MPITASELRRVARRDEIRDLVADARRAGARVGFVPTMGALHAGHLSLVAEARARADLVVMSLFVNPLQFGPAEDFNRYPRDVVRDADSARRAGVDVLFVPETAEMYAAAPTVTVLPERGAEEWEGAIRPGHFRGVLTVVAKLFNIVQPDVAIFGQKDIQQATLVRALVRDLDFPIALVVAPTVRDPDGLALSSRNAFLSPDDRALASRVPAALAAIEHAWFAGERSSATLEHAGREVLSDAAGLRADYLAVVEPVVLTRVDRADAGCIAMLAVRVGTTRLIDNVILGAGDAPQIVIAPAAR